jgi:hypothetical protein
MLNGVLLPIILVFVWLLINDGRAQEHTRLQCVWLGDVQCDHARDPGGAAHATARTN